MPKAAVDKDHLAQPRKHQVWLSRQIAAMESEAKSESVRHAPHQSLRSSVLAANRRHPTTSLFRSQAVHGLVVSGVEPALARLVRNESLVQIENVHGVKGVGLDNRGLSGIAGGVAVRKIISRQLSDSHFPNPDRITARSDLVSSLPVAQDVPRRQVHPRLGEVSFRPIRFERYL